MKSIKIKSLLAALLFLPLAAHAVPIEGGIIIGGALNPTCIDRAGACTMDVADGLDFTSGGGDDTALVDGGSGSFAGMAGMTVAMTDFIFDPFATVDPLWTVAGFSFALETLTIDTQTSTSLILFGTGTISGNGFDATAGSWSMSADAANPKVTFSWSSTTVVPEPAILVLMGIGLIGGLGARRLARS